MAAKKRKKRKKIGKENSKQQHSAKAYGGSRHPLGVEERLYLIGNLFRLFMPAPLNTLRLLHNSVSEIFGSRCPQALSGAVQTNT
jgi:hypothetical protein